MATNVAAKNQATKNQAVEDRPVRGFDDNERIHNAVAAEANALNTTTATALIGILATIMNSDQSANAQSRIGAGNGGLLPDATPHASLHADHSSPQPTPLDTTPSGTHEPTEASTSSSVAPVPPVVSSGESQESHKSGGSTNDGQSHDDGPAAFAPHSQSAVGLPVDVADHVSGSVAASHSGLPDMPAITADVWHDATSLTQTLSTMVTSTLDDSLASLSKTLSSLTDGLQQMTASLPDTADLTAGVTETASHLVQSTLAIPATAAGALVGTAFDTHAAAPPVHDLPTLDASALLPPLAGITPIQIGFAGQAHVDGHDAHDGAFSALGLHHF